MAWNPSPEVQVARDAAKAIERVTESKTVDCCVVIWLDPEERAGYASYGRTPVLCGMARRVADVAYESLMDSRKFDGILSAIARGNKNATDGCEIDFDVIEQGVVEKLRALKATLSVEMDPAIRKAFMRDLVIPAGELLARFCMCVNIDEQA
jgi:hypothetical protein